MNIQPMIDFIKEITEHGGSVLLKADGSTPATLTGKGFWNNDEAVENYLKQEILLPNFLDEVKRKGYGSIFLTTPHAERVIHARVFYPQLYPEISYLD